MSQTRETEAPAVELRALHKTFRTRGGDPVRAVDGVDLTVSPGEVVGFLGPNGAGKTTTLDMLLGLTEPTSGTVRVYGGGARQAIVDGRVSAVLQTGGLLRDLKLDEPVRLIASTYARPKPVGEVLERAGITKLAKRQVSKCSGGEQQRLRFALALLPDPDLLILDEPTAGMDVSARLEFWDAMRTEADEGRTVVFATHYLEEADSFAQRIVMIAGGRIVADGSTAQIRAQATGRVVSGDLRHGGAEALDRLVRDALGGLDADIVVAGSRVSIRSADSDAVARVMLNQLGAANLEIATESLESAFLLLTGESLAVPDHAVPNNADKEVPA